jgi:hypothetical protein
MQMKPKSESQKSMSHQTSLLKKAPSGTVTIAEEHEDRQVTLLTGVSGFGDSVAPLFISNNKTFEAERLAEQQLFHSHDYVIGSAEKTFVAEALFIGWLQTQFIPKTDQLRIQAHYDGPLIFLIDGDDSHITPRVVAYTGSQRIILIRLVAHSFHIS